MTDQPHRDDLTQLRAELAAQRAVTDTLRARLDRPRRRSPRRVLPLSLAALLVALLPLSLLAANPPTFSDLGEAAPVHQPNIQAIGDAGITTGFADPNNPNARLYSPKGLVTREEMASFLARTAGLGANPPVANAKTAQSAENATHAASADSATTAQSVQGYAASGLVRVAHAGSGNSSSSFTTTCSLFNDSYALLTQLTLDAPTAGYILVTGAASVYQTSGAGQRGLQVQVRIGTDVGISSVAFPGTTAQTAVTTWVFPVAAGTRTVVLEGCGYLASGAQTIHVNNPQLTALFVPFGPTGSP